MATATNDVERIVRRVLKEEQDETINAIQELSTLLTEQIIPRLSNGDSGESGESEESDWEQADDSDDGDVGSMSASDGEGATNRRRKPSPNGHDDADDSDMSEREIPSAVIEAFTAAYHTLSSEQAAAFAELFTIVDSQLDDEGKEKEDEEHDEEARV